MGRLILAMFLTVDGFTETDEGEMIGPAWSDDLQRHWAGANARDGQMLLYGRRSFEYNADFWTNADRDGQPEGLRSLARVMNRLPKVVISSTLTTSSWNATVHSGTVDDVTANLKNEFPGDIVAVGGMQLARGLLASEALDELRLLIMPQIAGGGRSIFDGTARPGPWSLHSTQPLDTGAVALTYRR